MRKILLFLISACSLLLTATSFKHGRVPDPEDYARSFVDVLRKKDRELYLNTFALTTSDLAWLSKIINANPYMTEGGKQSWNSRIGDSVLFIQNIREDLGRNYNHIERWCKEDTIDLSQLEYATCYFELEYDPKEPFYICEDLMICVKYKDKYFAFSIDEAVYVNGRWTYGEVDGISERNQYWKYVSETNYTEYSISVDSAAAPAYYEEAVPVEAPAAEMVLNKKQQKIQKKINAENAKLDKLFQQMRESY